MFHLMKTDEALEPLNCFFKKQIKNNGIKSVVSFYRMGES